MNLDDILLEAEEKMVKTEEFLVKEFSGVRTGKASPGLVENLQVEAYGSTMRLREMAGISTPESRMILIQPWDKGTIQAIEKAIRDSDLGLNPASQGNLIRIPIPALSEERRRELVKVVHKLAEEGRVAIRHGRTDVLHKIKKVEHISEDEKTRAEKEIQKIHDEHIKQIDAVIHTKEAEIMEV